jgi:hypothetical protein
MFNHGKCDINEACIAASLLLEKVCLICLTAFASQKLLWQLCACLYFWLV